MLTKASNDLAKSKQLVGLLKQQIEQGNTELSEELDKANERISMLSEDLSDANARIYVLEVALTQAESDNSELRAEVSRLHSKADDYEKANALLDIADKAQVDYKTIIEVLLHRKFAHNSDMTNLLNGVLDTSDAEVNELGLDGLKKKISDAADEALDEKHKDEESKASSAPEQPAVKLPKKTEKEKQESDSQLPRKRYTTTARVLKSFGIDKSDLPENAKVIIRKGKKDMWVVRLFFYQKQEVYCKEYKIARFNVPGSDPQSSKYPQSIIKGNPLMPSFCRFYLESKFAYHLSENRLLDMLSQMGMKVAQSTLNGWMQQIMTYLRERLGPVITADRAVLYETIEKDLEEMGLVRTACWFHARHRFVDAYISDHRVRVIILMMNYLFQIERESKIRKHTAKQRRRFRFKYSASIVGKLMKLLKKIKLDSSYGAMVQRAVNYVLDDEKAFKVFLQDGRVEMHNNAVERMFRHLAMGRRNWLHTGSHLGAENIAFMFSLFESCKLNDINFGDYIEDILTRLMEGEQDFMSLIPCNYNSNKKVNVKAA
ncbi:MAG: IS66 family transposase [Segatella copri]